MASVRLFVVATVLTCSATCLGQPLTVGSLGTPTGVLGPGPLTAIDFYNRASREGTISSATFYWSSSPCPAAVKIKIFDFIGTDFHMERLVFTDERGPFDVTATLQTVALVPPIRVSLSSYIGITSLTTCGAPVTGGPGGALVLDGDFRYQVFFGAIFGPNTPLQVLVRGTDDSGLSFLKNRFRTTLTATDPRTGKTTAGRGVSQEDRYGYFSLPDFTGDPDFPEIVVKMADATGSPPPYGGSFWFFYSALTDVQYTLTVTDQLTGRARAYSNIQGGPGQLCGGADTDAFRP